MLNDRQKTILRAVIKDYIQNAEPIGSRTIARRHDLGVSSATIRNEMADLEETGYLQQPHVSAGRVPSDKGYRFYVDMLMEPEKVSDEEGRQVQRQVLAHRKEMEKLIHQTARLIAMLTRSTSVVIAPPVEACVLRHLQIVPVDEENVLVVLVLSPGMVQNKLIPTSRHYTPEELSKVSDALNKRLKGITYRELGLTLIREITEDYGDLGRALLEVITQGLFEHREEQVHFNGTLYLLDQPEFKDVDRVKSFFSVLDDKEVLMNVFSDLASNSGVSAVIGQENKKDELKSCSLVTATYHMGGNTIGTIGVIGPTRMEYARMFSVVEFMADSLSEILSEFIK